MKSAAPKTYISRRTLDKYRQQRLEQKSKSAASGGGGGGGGGSAPNVPARAFAEDAVAAVNDVNNASSLPAVEEEKKETPQNNDRNSSADELDSDDLDGDINLSDEEQGTNVRASLRQRADPNAAQASAQPRERHV